MNIGDINSRVWDRLGEDSADPQRFTAAMILTLMKEAVEQWSVVIGNDTSTQALTLVNDQLEYSLSTDYARIIEVSSTDDDFKLECIHWHRLYKTEGMGRNRRWRNVKGVRPTHFVPFSYDKIWLWPTLSDASAASTITVTFQRPVTDDLTSGDTDVPTVPVQYQPYIVDYIVGRLLMLNARGERLAEAVELIGRWTEALDAMSDHRRNRAHNWAPEPEVIY